MNEKQRESLVKYLYDISKGALLADVAAALTQKISYTAFVLLSTMAAYAFIAAFRLEGFKDEHD